MGGDNFQVSTFFWPFSWPTQNFGIKDFVWFRPQNSLSSSAVDSFIPQPPLCHYANLLKGQASEQPQACLTYDSWISLLPSPYLANPITRINVDKLLGEASRLQVSPQELIQVYQTARPSHSVDDRLARVRTFLLFKETSLSNGNGLAYDFHSFVQSVMAALKVKGAVHIQEVDRILDELGRPLSGDYQELNDRTVQISLSSTDFYGDWLKYVTLHELQHWYEVSQKKSHQGYEEEEVHATYSAMKVLKALKGYAAIQFKGFTPRLVFKQGNDKLVAVQDGIKKMPGNVQPTFYNAWSQMRPALEADLTPSYIEKIRVAVEEEFESGIPNKGLVEEVTALFRRREEAKRVVLEMDQLIKLVQTSPSQISLALNGLEKLLSHQRRPKTGPDPIVGTP